MPMVPVQYVNPFFAAVKNVCQQTLHVPISTGPLRLHQPGETLWEPYPVAALIHLQGGVRGLVAFDFCLPVALGLAGGLAGEKYAQFNDDARDALGEVANLITGSAKRDLPGELVTISTPQILQTRAVSLPPGVPSLILPFESDLGPFVLNIAFAQVGFVPKKKVPELSIFDCATFEAPREA